MESSNTTNEQENRRLAKASSLTQWRVFLFWLPLAATWLMMALEQPFVNAIVARLSRPELNLAALGVAYSIVLIFEAPIFMVMAAATTLAHNHPSYRKLRNFTLALGGTVSLFAVVAFSDKIFPLLAQLLALPPAIAESAQLAGIYLVAMPLVVAFRRLNQGILIRHNLTQRVGLATIVRFGGMAAASLILYAVSDLPGASLGGLAVMTGVFLESLATRLMVHSVLRDWEKPLDEEGISYIDILSFYAPLALNGWIIIASNPLLTFFLSKSADPVRSLAVFPVINGLMFCFSSGPLAVQETTIANLGERHENFAVLSRFSSQLTFLIALALGALFWTPLGWHYFTGPGGLSDELAGFAVISGRVASFLPVITGFTIWQRAILLKEHMTMPITIASSLELLFLGGLMLAATHLFPSAFGANLAFACLVIARIAGALSLRPFYARARECAD